MSISDEHVRFRRIKNLESTGFSKPFINKNHLGTNNSVSRNILTRVWNELEIR